MAGVGASADQPLTRASVRSRAWNEGNRLRTANFRGVPSERPVSEADR